MAENAQTQRGVICYSNPKSNLCSTLDLILKKEKAAVLSTLFPNETKKTIGVFTPDSLI